MREKLPVITALAALGIAVILGVWLRFSMGRPADSEPLETVSAAPQSGRSARVEERLQMLRESYARQHQGDTAAKPDAPTPGAAQEHDGGKRVRGGWHAHDSAVKAAAAPVAPQPKAQRPPPNPPAVHRTFSGNTIPMSMSFSRRPAFLYKNTSTDELEETILHGADRPARMEALDQLAMKEPEDALRILSTALVQDDLDPEVLVGVIDGLGDFTDEIPPEMIAPALRNQNANVRFEAVSLLGDMDTPAARAALQGASNDPDPEVRELAKGILEINR